MIIFPAIDIKNGKVVRLLQGQFDQITEYAQDPIEMAKKWELKGAKWLHIVDLDGALTGESKNSDIIYKIAQSIKIPIQIGGGIRSKKTITSYLENGIKRVILGTKVVEDLDFLKEILKQWNNNIAVSLDCSNGLVAQRGWTKTSNIRAIDLIPKLEKTRTVLPDIH